MTNVLGLGTFLKQIIEVINEKSIDKSFEFFDWFIKLKIINKIR